MYEPAPLPKGTGGTWGGNPKRFGGQEGEEMASTSVGNPGNVRMGTETHWTPKDAVSDQVAQVQVQAGGGARFQPNSPEPSDSQPTSPEPANPQPTSPEPAKLDARMSGVWVGNPGNGARGYDTGPIGGRAGEEVMGTETHWTPKDAVSDQVAQAKVQARGGDAGIARYQPRTPDAAPPPRKHDPAPIQPSTPGPAKRPSERMAPKGPDDPRPEGLRPHIIDFDPVNFRAKGEAYNPGKPIPSSAEKKIPPLPTP